MRRIITYLLGANALLLLLLSSSASAQSASLEFRQDLNGYQGTRDTSIQGPSSTNATTATFNFGGSQALSVRQGQFRIDPYITDPLAVSTPNINSYYTLINFEDIFGNDRNQINRPVRKAELVLTAFRRQFNLPSTQVTLSLGALKKPFVEGDGGWYEFTEGRQRGTFVPGATSMIFQRSPETGIPARDLLPPDSPYLSRGTLWGNNNPSSTIQSPVAGVDFYYITQEPYVASARFMFGEFDGSDRGAQLFTNEVAIIFDVTDIVQAWQRGTLPHHGFFLYNSVANAPSVDFYSSEYEANPELRPRLLIQY